jgi:16S rRNA (cytosine1402-N4)-methyltransferase
MGNDTFYHQPVLLHECIEQLNIIPDGIYLDATFGGGGHSREILKQLSPKGKLLVFDQDEDAKRNVPDNDNRVVFIRENFRYAARFVRMYGLQLNGVLADLGVSSWQFDTAERGFSTRFDAQLDMRMDHRLPVTAADILKQYSEKELFRLFDQYGEVTNAKPLARRIVEVREKAAIQTSNELKQAIDGLMYGNPNKYLAQVFQGLRIEVNDELNALQEFLVSITSALKPGGRLCIITFHSLEDRLVKQWMKEEAFGSESLPMMMTAKPRLLKVLTKKPILPGIEEQNKNSRSRSAKLRVAERILIDELSTNKKKKDK